LTKSRNLYAPRDSSIAERLDKYAPMGAPDECWEWTGCRDVKGYGRIRYQGRIIRAHRVAYEAAYGPVLNGLHVLHSCDNSACTNPRHLSAGTNLQNQREAWTRDRKRGARKLSPQQVVAIRASSEPPSVLAPLFGVGRAQISRIKNGQRGDGILLMLKEVA
jgi:hypothetical protein